MFKKKYSIPIILIIVLSFAFIGCAGMQAKSSKEKVIMFQQFYISQYDNYQKMTEKPEVLTEEQKVVLRAKREMLVNLEKAIKAYELVVDSGMPPSQSDEQEIYDLIDQITNQAVGGK